jgi:hypothetical protein
MERIRAKLTYANVMATLAVFIALGGTALASVIITKNGQVARSTISGHNPPRGKHPNIIRGSVNGKDVLESTLGEVPRAMIGGIGRWTGNAPGTNTCNPDSLTYVSCVATTVNLPRPARVLVIGEVQAFANGTAYATGRCRIGTASGPLLDTETLTSVADPETDNAALVGITGVLPAGEHSFGVDCNQVSGNVAYVGPGVATVAISPD